MNFQSIGNVHIGSNEFITLLFLLSNSVLVLVEPVTSFNAKLEEV